MIITDGPVPAAHFALLSGAMSSAAQVEKRKRTDLSVADKVWVIRLHEKEPALTQKRLAEALSQRVGAPVNREDLKGRFQVAVERRMRRR